MPEFYIAMWGGQKYIDAHPVTVYTTYGLSIISIVFLMVMVVNFAIGRRVFFWQKESNDTDDIMDMITGTGTSVLFMLPMINLLAGAIGLLVLAALGLLETRKYFMVTRPRRIAMRETSKAQEQQKLQKDYEEVVEMIYDKSPIPTKEEIGPDTYQERLRMIVQHNSTRGYINGRE